MWRRMMLIEVIAIVSLSVNAVQLYFYLKRTKQDDSSNLKNEKMIRVKDVVNKYVQFRESSKDAGFSALFKSGVKSLHDDDEIEQVLRQITDKGYKSPLGREEEKLRSFGLKKFFNIATYELMKNKSIDVLISDNKNGD
jgi:hypothetical protein